MGLVEKDKKYIWHPFTQMKTAEKAIPIVKGKGTLLIDEKGNTYIDAISSWWVNLHGHSHPYIAEKVYAQMQKLEHVVFAGFTHKPAVELCEKLSKHLPSNQAKFFFSGDGSSAVEIALKMAVQYWKNKGENKTRFVALDGAYHGETFGAMSAGGRSIFSAPFSDLLFECTHIPFPKDEQAAIQSLKTEIDKGGIAAFIFEPLVQGAAGMRMYKAETLNKLMQICKDAGVLCIADEVMTGFRIAPGGVQEKEGVIPDLTAMGKIIGGGLPVGAFGGRADIMACLAPEGPVYQAGTLSGNPLAMVAGITALELLEDLTIYSKLELAGKRIAQALTDAALGKGLPLQVPQRGSMFALFFSEEPVTNFEQAVASSADHFKVLFRYALDNGVYLAPSAFETCFISTAHDEKAITRTIEVLTEGIRKI